jgi:GDP-L-fucose synthase
MRILVTGGSGFIGRNLREHLEKRHEVLAPTHAELDLTDDRAVNAWFRANDVNAVIHGAVRPGHRGVQDPSRQLWTNLRMFFNLERNRERFERLVFLSSGAAYDTQESLIRVPESRLGESIPEDEHGLSKYAIAKFLDSRGRSPGAQIVELRLFGVFGRYEDYGVRFISNAICRALWNLPITLRQDRRFSYLYIDDLMPIVDWALAGQHRHVAYNVAPDWTDSLRDLGRVVAACVGAGARVIVAMDGLGNEYTADNSRLRAELPDLLFTPSREAVTRLYAWYSDHRSEIDPARIELER